MGYWAMLVLVHRFFLGSVARGRFVGLYPQPAVPDHRSNLTAKLSETKFFALSTAETYHIKSLDVCWSNQTMLDLRGPRCIGIVYRRVDGIFFLSESRLANLFIATAIRTRQPRCYEIAANFPPVTVDASADRPSSGGRVVDSGHRGRHVIQAIQIQGIGRYLSLTA